MNAYLINSAIRNRCTFTDPNNSDAKVDPTTVTVKYKAPNSPTVEKVHVTDVEVIKESTGVYYIDIIPTEVGRWWVLWDGDGTVDVSAERWFRVDDDHV